MIAIKQINAAPAMRSASRISAMGMVVRMSIFHSLLAFRGVFALNSLA
jgi:hypothetical protein